MFTFDADVSLIDQGAWVDYQNSKFLIAHMSNLKFQRALARLQQPYRRKIESGTMDPEVSKNLICRAMAEGILLDWKDVRSSSGEVNVPYTVEAGYTALFRNPEFRDFVSDFAMNLSNFRSEAVDSLGKASLLGSNGASNGVQGSES